MAASAQPDARSAWASGSQVIHLDLECRGLDRLREFGRDPVDTFTEMSYARPADLIGTWVAGQPTSLCRLCAVEPVVADIISAYPLADGDPGVFATFTLSRPAPQGKENIQANLRARAKAKNRYPDDPERTRALAQEAGDRLARIAEIADLRVTRANYRPAAYGFLSPKAIDELTRVVHLEPKVTVKEMPDAELVSTFWTMRVAAERSIAESPDGSAEPTDPWYLAELVCLAPVEDRDSSRNGSYA